MSDFSRRRRLVAYQREHRPSTRSPTRRLSAGETRGVIARRHGLAPGPWSGAEEAQRSALRHQLGRRRGRWLLHCSIGQTLEGSFSAVSKPNFARKYAFESSRRDLHNALLCTAQLCNLNFVCQNSAKFFAKSCKIQQISATYLEKFAKFWLNSLSKPHKL